MDSSPSEVISFHCHDASYFVLALHNRNVPYFSVVINGPLLKIAIASLEGLPCHTVVKSKNYSFIIYLQM